ncbi:hypothetical protein MPSEU_001079000 [Mayamaea pseudoterrestris]|nr:hypothetical protein MPSEU_001079000 [Mayamaea pseudoterrestris]
MNTSVSTTEKVVSLLGWPTTTISIQWTKNDNEPKEDPATLHNSFELSSPDTVIFFVPGNPGLVQFYVPMLLAMMQRLGPGFAAFGASHAGHGVTNDSNEWELGDNMADETIDNQQQNHEQQGDTSISWTMEGQVLHKMAFIDHILQSLVFQHSSTLQQPFIIFISHSIGSYLTQQLLLLRPDVLLETQLLIQLMPFTRMNAPLRTQLVLDLIAKEFPKRTAIRMLQQFSRVMARLPEPTVDAILLRHGNMTDAHARSVASKLVRNASFAGNFLELGSREIRQVPRHLETSSLRYINAYAPIAMLLAKNDHWAPQESLTNDIKLLQKQDILPENVDTHYNAALKHDFVSYSGQSDVVVDFCVEQIGIHCNYPARAKL